VPAAKPQSPASETAGGAAFSAPEKDGLVFDSQFLIWRTVARNDPALPRQNQTGAEAPPIENQKSKIENFTAASRRSFIASNLAGALALGASTPLLAAAAVKTAGSGARIISPPGSRGTRRFTSQCTACQLCVSACPSHVIEPSLLAYGTLNGLLKPRLNFDHSFCNFDCTVCGEVCPDGAIEPLSRDTKHTTRIGVAEVTLSRCIVITEDTACGACAEHCPTAALQMKQGSARFAQPEVSAQYCIGCGACQYACPAHPEKAVIVRGFPEHEKADVLIQGQAEAPKGASDDFAF
jgi:ferredoxin